MNEQMANAFVNAMKNPMQVLGGMGLPNAMQNPGAAVQQLMQNGRMTQQQFDYLRQTIMKMKQTPFYNGIFK